MPASFSPGYFKGFYAAQLYVVGPYGISLGNQISLANGTVSPSILMRKVKTASFAVKDIVSEDLQGGDKISDTAEYGNSKVEPFDLVVSDHDPATDALLSQSVLNSTLNTEYPMWGINSNSSQSLICGLILTQRVQQTKVSVNGQDQYHHYVFPRCAVRVKKVGPAFQQSQPRTYRIIPKYSDRNFHGVGFDSTGLALGFEEDLADVYEFNTQYPVHLVTFRKDGTAVTFNTTYKVASTVVTSGATANWLSSGSGAAPSTFGTLASITAPGVATLSAAGTTADYAVLLYQTANYAPSG